jgi:hypothetical protein
MKSILFFSFILISFFSNSQISKFLKSDEFEKIKNNISGQVFNGLEDIWIQSYEDKDITTQVTNNSYTWEDIDATHSIFIDKDYVIFSYHLSVGTNTGTLVYDRSKNLFKTYFINSTKLTGRLLKVTREGYKNGHWWQDGVFNLSKYTISWNSKITR